MNQEERCGFWLLGNPCSFDQYTLIHIMVYFPHKKKQTESAKRLGDEGFPTSRVGIPKLFGDPDGFSNCKLRNSDFQVQLEHTKTDRWMCKLFSYEAYRRKGRHENWFPLIRKRSFRCRRSDGSLTG